ncbi:MAG: ABC transporter permease, partial [Thermoguttaceae bacterium]
MKFVLNLALSRMKRQKKRLFFVLLAIAASSCLVVWTIGGFQALFIDETTQEANYLGEYDLRVASKTFGVTMGKRPDMGEFVNPTKRENYASRPMISEHPSATSNASPNPSSTQAAPQGRSSGGSPGGRPGGGKGSPNALNRPGGRASTPVLDERLVQELRHDDSVSRCDEVAILRMFVYAPGTEKAILEDADAEDEGDRKTIKRSLVVDDSEIDEAPEGMDPELHRRAFGAYRSTMGTPMGMGSTFWSTTATESPYELEDGRWLSAAKDDSPAPKEAVMTVKGAEKYGAKVGDPLALLAVSTQSTRAIEFQLSVVGIVDDPDCDGFYVSEALGRELAQASGAEYGVNAVFLKLRSDVDAFRSKWSERLTSAPGDLEATTKQDLVDRRIAVFKQEQSFKYQAVSGALLASLAALLIVFTALNTSVDDERRLIAFYRVAGLTRSQIAASILGEGFVLAIPGWIAGMAAGWVLVFLISGKPTGINLQTSGLSFLCTVVGAIFAALYPMFRATRVAPLEALGVRVSSTPYAQTRRRTRRISAICAVVGLAALSADAALIRATSFDAPTRAAIHSGLGVLALALGVILMIPSAIYATEWLVVPIASRLMRVDSRSIRRELSGNASRVVAVAVALSVGGGLFATMQIWGYSMLDPFLPGRRAPAAFAAFLPNGLSDEGVDELRRAPMVDPDRFLTVAVEQAAFAAGSIPVESQKSQFANVVFFGVD